ncbi:MAG: VCBS repeat-containing protein [Rhodothermales bacterium]|nr:VCBS repeat-containing protein [Rhodothermales bacterium]MBO6781113.1 VCBS repeat-containing protein [Rhodothermales bacterium]
MTVRACALLVILMLAGCKEAPSREDRVEPEVTARFTELPADYTNVAFENRLTDTAEQNVFAYRNYYDGGGVGIGDFNGDGLEDVFLTSNQEANRLYVNRGDFWFEDITEAAGVGGTHAWSTGVSVVDVNADGLPDIYVCNSGDVRGDDRANELFINLGPDQDRVPRFEEAAAQWGLADTGYSTHAVFFDMDRDGDLDVFVMNNSSRPITSFPERQIRATRHPDGGDRLYRNDGGTYTDISRDANIWGSEIAFGLGTTVGDYDRDGWPDLYISNDFFERDYLYRNQRDGTFEDVLEAAMAHISQSSMGADMGDINNDALPDIYVTDMLPPDDARIKQVSTFDSWTGYQNGLEEDFYHQVMRNTLQLNDGDGTFREVGQAWGVAATDWSWSALLVDLDMDGLKDIHVTNGIYRDLTDQDFLEYFGSDDIVQQWRENQELDVLDILDRIPSRPLANVAFRNVGGRFEDVSTDWALTAPGWSNGAAYSDLDNDGDPDLVVNNVNQQAGFFRNETNPAEWLRPTLEGDGDNSAGIGAQITLHHAGGLQYLEQMPNRGFQSSVSPRPLFALPAPADSLEVLWPDGRRQVLSGPLTGDVVLRQADAAAKREAGPRARSEAAETWYRRLPDPGISHTENEYDDFQRQPLLLKTVSRDGPRLAVGDVNGDGREDLFVGGAKESPGRLLIGTASGGFRLEQEFSEDAVAEDMGAAFFDADSDGGLDLYVASGGNEFSRQAPALRDRLYLGPGMMASELPLLFESSALPLPADVDRDGDQDVFVPGGMVPWAFGQKPPHHLLRGDGRGNFTAETVAADLGMVSEGTWADLTGDGSQELVVVGPWEPVRVLDADFQPIAMPGLDSLHGWWHRVHAADVDGDGDIDLLLGNVGTNAGLHTPLEMQVGDFDSNGWTEQLVSAAGRPYPLRGELLAQLPSLADRLTSHEAYATMTFADFVDLPSERVLRIDHLRSFLAENTPDGFVLHPMPEEAQWAPVTAFAVLDLNRDGRLEIVAAGNHGGFIPRIGPLDAGRGVVFNFEGGEIRQVPRHVHGLDLRGEVRDMAVLKDGRLVVAHNNGPVTLWGRR